MDRDRVRRRRRLAASVAVWLIAAAAVAAAFLTQERWRPWLDAYLRYRRYAHSTAELMSARPGATFQDCNPRAQPVDCPVMVVIPQGRFMMGSADNDLEAEDVERPMHEVAVARLAVSQHETTFNDWEACVRGGGCPAATDDSGFGRGDRPVINVTWHEAQMYAKWLSRMTGQPYRLLTEAEWEYAARGGTTLDAPHRRFSWGDDQPSCDRDAPNGAASYYCPGGSLAGTTFPVGWFRHPNPFGLFDMHGNVWEWVEDCWHDQYNVYDGAPADGRAWVSRDCDARVMRGGAWDGEAEALRSAKRARFEPADRNNDGGFRIARTP